MDLLYVFSLTRAGGRRNWAARTPANVPGERRRDSGPAAAAAAAVLRSVPSGFYAVRRGERWDALPASTSRRAGWSTAATRTSPTRRTRPPPSRRARRPPCTASSSRPTRRTPSPPWSRTRAGTHGPALTGSGKRTAADTCAQRPRLKPAEPASRYEEWMNEWMARF